MKNIGIIGCGWLGLHLAEHLYPTNKIFTTTTSEAKKSQITLMGFDLTIINFSSLESSKDITTWKNLDILDAIIITVPFPKQVEINSLLQRFENISQFITGYKKQLFLMSSIGIYPQFETEIEESTFNDNFLVPNLIQVENLMKNKFPQANILRLGGLMGKDRIFSKYKTQPANQVVNHVHFEDICLIIEKMISKNYSSKIYNVVAPLHPTKLEIINFQKGISHNVIIKEKPQGRKILTKLLMDELNYEYKNPDPKMFY